MKQWMIVFAVAFALLILSGCERKKPEEDQAFDPKTDARSSTVDTAPDPGVAADQKTVSRKMGVVTEKTTPAAAAAGGAKTPKQAIDTLLKAVADGDKGTVVAMLDAPGKLPDVVGSAVALVPSAAKFEEAMKKAYGEDVFEKASSAEPAPGGMPFGPEMVTGGLAKLKDRTWLDKVQIKVDGNEATATLEGQEVKLAKKDGTWKISLGEMLPVKDLAKLKPLIDAASEALPKIKGVVDQSTKKVGKAGNTAEKILAEMKAELEPVIAPLFGQVMQLMMSGMEEMNMETTPAEAPAPAAP